jgi:predicted ArsR family transcriptional regulator
MNATQKRILETLHSHPASSAAELARALNLTAANVRHHLEILVQGGLVEASGQRPSAGRGRPTRLYRLAAGARANNLAALASTLLEHVLSGLDAGAREQALQELGKALAAGAQPPAGLSLSRRLTAAVQQLNRQFYMARWEAHASAPRVMLARCPYAAILAGHPECCSMDAHLLEALLAHPVRQTARIDLEHGLAPACVFVLEKPSG